MRAFFCLLFVCAFFFLGTEQKPMDLPVNSPNEKTSQPGPVGLPETHGPRAKRGYGYGYGYGGYGGYGGYMPSYYSPSYVYPSYGYGSYGSYPSYGGYSASYYPYSGYSSCYSCSYPYGGGYNYYG